MTPLRIALQFLTRLPIRVGEVTPRDIPASHYFYPFVGLLIGIAAVLLRHILFLAFPPPFSIVLILAFLVWITGGLHDDGLADIADGMGGGWTREDRLAIMKDSHTGAFGALILVLAVLAKYAALTSMNPARLDAAIVTAQILGRWAFLPLGYFNPYAREGLGSALMKGMRRRTIVVGTVISGPVVILLNPAQGGVSFLVAIAVIVAASSYFRRRIGGITGDCFGATFQFVEIATYAVFLA
jgi:adenosylcobinamide-GDP ribazoletransferase